MSKTPGTSFEFSQSPSLVESVGIEPLWSHVYTELTPQNFPSTIARGDVPERLFLGPEIYGRGSEVAPSMTAEEIKSVLEGASGIRITSPRENKDAGQEPDFILGEDGRLRPNPKKAEPGKDGSINIELETKNREEVEATKIADQLQKAAIKELVSFFMRNYPHKDVPQHWLDMLSKEPDLPPAPVPLDSSNNIPAPVAEIPQPRLQPEVQPRPQPSQPVQEIPQTIQPSLQSVQGGPAPGQSQSGGGDGGAGGGFGAGGGNGGGNRGNGGYSGGSGGGRDVGAAPYVPRQAEIGETSALKITDNTPGAPSPGLVHLREAIDRANNGGKPVSVLHYGDSHIVAGTEPKTIENQLKAIAPVDYHTQAKIGISANYPLTHQQEWLDKPIRDANPDLVILSFGGNDAAGPVNKEAYEKQYQSLIDNVRQRAPNASILVVGPGDGNSIVGANKGNTLPGLDAVVAAQKEVAARNGLEFIDMREAMGGPGSIERWHAEGLAAGDKLHLTAKGYQRMGQTIAEHIKQEVA